MVLAKAKGLDVANFHAIFNSYWKDEQRSRKRDMRKKVRNQLQVAAA
jgi:hypothetical protein